MKKFYLLAIFSAAAIAAAGICGCTHTNGGNQTTENEETQYETRVYESEEVPDGTENGQDGGNCREHCERREHFGHFHGHFGRDRRINGRVEFHFYFDNPSESEEIPEENGVENGESGANGENGDGAESVENKGARAQKKGKKMLPKKIYGGRRKPVQPKLPIEPPDDGVITPRPPEKQPMN